jgi:hypothetical protein
MIVDVRQARVTFLNGSTGVTYCLCRCKVRMSGLSKVEMSGFMGGRGPMDTERMALSQPERDRLRVLHEIEQGDLTQVAAAQRIKITDRQVRRLLLRLSLAYDCRVVDKYIWPVIASNEAVAFRIIEPFDLALHLVSFLDRPVWFTPRGPCILFGAQLNPYLDYQRPSAGRPPSI